MLGKFDRPPLARALLTLAACFLASAATAECSLDPASETPSSCRDAAVPIGPADFAILITLQLTAAEIHCPYRIEEGRLRRLLNHHGLALGQAYTARRSQQLNAAVDKVLESFRTDRQKACDDAWQHFGPAATFEGFLQPRQER